MPIALAVLLLGLPAGLFALWPLLRRHDMAMATLKADARAELEAEKRLALRAIRELDLDREAGHLADDDYADLRARYEARASAILRKLDALGPEVPATPARRAAPATAAPVPQPLGQPAGWSRQPLVLTTAACGLVVFGIVLGVLAVRFTGPPPETPADAGSAPTAVIPGAPGAPPAGEASAGAASGAGSRPIPPGMLQGMLQAARASLEAGRVQEAIAAYQAVLKREPQNVDALSHFGLILAMAGHADQALEYLDRALAVNPDYPEALSYSAQVRFELKQDYAGAIAAWERFAKVVENPAARDEALARVRDARSRLTSTPPAPGPATTPLQGSKPPTSR
jgi:tetratricopeptide (TPR) repeat protein